MSQDMVPRCRNRKKAVLPVRIKGKDVSGDRFEELVHTLDVTATGARLGSVRHELNLQDEITAFYRQRRMRFRVVWIRKMKGSSEFQVGLQAVTVEGEAWGLGPAEQEMTLPGLSAPPAPGLA